MTDVIFNYAASEKLRNLEIIDTGERGQENRSLVVSMQDMTPAQRKIVITAIEKSELLHEISNAAFSQYLVATWDKNGNVAVNLRQTAVCRESQSCQLYGTALGFSHDAELNLEMAIATTRAATESLLVVLAHHQDTINRNQAAYEKCLVLLENDGTAAMAAASEFGIYNWSPAGTKTISWIINARNYKQKKEDALTLKKREAAMKAQREQDKETWISENGSARLKESFARGYHSQSGYVEERAAQEAPGWLLDFRFNADWKTRTYPTTAALAVEDEAAALAAKIGGQLDGVVWLTEPPTPEDMFIYPCEAVVISDYLGKYDLIKVV